MAAATRELQYPDQGKAVLAVGAIGQIGDHAGQVPRFGISGSIIAPDRIEQIE